MSVAASTAHQAEAIIRPSKTEFRGILTGQPEASGRVVRWNAENEGWDVLADGLVTPTGITVGWDGTIFVTQEYIGQIVQIRS